MFMNQLCCSPESVSIKLLVVFVSFIVLSALLIGRRTARSLNIKPVIASLENQELLFFESLLLEKLLSIT